MRLFLALLCLIGCAPPLHAGWDWLPWKSSTSAEKSASAAPKGASISLTSFSGSTGSSARRNLHSELLRSGRLAVLRAPDAAGDYTLSASSSSGRIDATLTSQTKGRLFERTYAAPGLDENVKTLADDIIYAITGSPGLATSRIVFVSDQSGTHQIYMCDPDGRNVHQLTRDPLGAVSPSLSPDATLMAYTSYGGGYSEVRLLDLGGGFERSITDTSGGAFGAAFAPDGVHLALIMGFLGNPELFITDLNTTSAACASETLGAPSSPAWHPDGRRLLYSVDEGSGPRLYLADFGSEKQGGGLTRWRSGYRYATDAEWSPDGRQVAFTARSRGSWLVVTREFPSGDARVVRRNARHPSWSPDGRHLIYAEAGDLCIFDLSKNTHRPIITEFGIISEPRWMH
ncbi:MAG: PD40 domain-containing protein [Verrucomicrobiales bacterium]|nr:PD40 domain-containing protein [Verrucomicrobiales bacterium]